MFQLKIVLIMKSGETYSKIEDDSDVNAEDCLLILENSILYNDWYRTDLHSVKTSEIESMRVEEIKEERFDKDGYRITD
jgi:hypothetical protein